MTFNKGHGDCLDKNVSKVPFARNSKKKALKRGGSTLQGETSHREVPGTTQAAKTLKRKASGTDDVSYKHKKTISIKGRKGGLERKREKTVKKDNEPEPQAQTITTGKSFVPVMPRDGEIKS